MNEHLSRNEINVFVRYLRDGTLPNGSRFAQMRFRKHAQRFVVRRDNALYHVDGREVLSVDRIPAVIAEWWTDPARTASSRDRLYSKLSARYYGISIKDVDDYLKKQPAYQKNQQLVRERVVKPITASRPNQHWECDLLDLSSEAGFNSRRKYLLNVIDVFSKYAWSFPLLDKTALRVSEKLRELFRARRPTLLQTDNGTEFKGEVSLICLEFGVKQVFSRAYSSTLQGCIENFNWQVRQMIRLHRDRTHCCRYVDVLDDLVNSYNNTVHGVTKRTPSSLHNPGVAPAEVRGVRKRIRRRALNVIREAKIHFVWLGVGDHVRVSKLTTTEGRRQHKEDVDKQQANWSDTIYVVATVSRPRLIARGRVTYRLNTLDGRRLPTVYRRDDLLKVEPPPAAPPPPPPAVPKAPRAPPLRQLPVIDEPRPARQRRPIA